MNAIQELEKLGYVVTLDGNKISYSYSGKNHGPKEAREFLERLRANKDKAIHFLRLRELQGTTGVIIPLGMLHEWLEGHSELHQWLEEHNARIIGRSWVDKSGAITVRVEDANGN